MTALSNPNSASLSSHGTMNPAFKTQKAITACSLQRLRPCPFCGTEAFTRYSALYWQHPSRNQSGDACILDGTIIWSPDIWNARDNATIFQQEDDELHEIIPSAWKHEVIEFMPPLPKRWSASVWGEGFQVFGESSVSPTVALCKAIVAAFSGRSVGRGNENHLAAQDKQNSSLSSHGISSSVAENKKDLGGTGGGESSQP